MEMKPKVSIIVPVYNAALYLDASIASLLGQSLQEIEIIIVNDGSSDGTGNVIDRLASEDGRIKALHLPENMGVHEARIAGLTNAKAPWIGFLDSDDFARPSMYESMHSKAVSENVDIVVCGSYRVTPERKIIAAKYRFKQNKKIEKNIFELFCRLEFGTGSLCNKLYRRDIIKSCEDMHFPWRQSINEDLLMNIRCFRQAESVYLCKDMLHEYVLNHQSVTSTSNNAISYVNTYRAAALAVNMLAGLDRESLLKVIDLYRTQLSWNDYQIDEIELIADYEDQLKEASDLMNRVYPPALALLAARSPGAIGAKAALIVLINRLFGYFKPGS